MKAPSYDFSSNTKLVDDDYDGNLVELVVSGSS